MPKRTRCSKSETMFRAWSLVASSEKGRIAYQDHAFCDRKKTLRPNPCMLTKKLIVLPFCAKKHWTATFVFNANCIETFRTKTTVESRNLAPTFLRYYCPFRPSRSADVPLQHDLLFLLNLAYSFSKHCKLPSFEDFPMKMRDVYHSYSEEYLRGSQYFPATRLRGRRWLPKQIDTYSCGMGVLRQLPQFVATLLKKKQSASW